MKHLDTVLNGFVVITVVGGCADRELDEAYAEEPAATTEPEDTSDGSAADEPELDPDPPPELDDFSPSACSGTLLELPMQRFSATGPVVRPNGDSLSIQLGTHADRCGDPLLKCEEWRLQIILAPMAQAPGVYEIDRSDGVRVYENVAYTNELGACSYATSFTGGGWLEIFYIDEDVVMGALCGQQNLMWSDAEIDGSFVATRCP